MDLSHWHYFLAIEDDLLRLSRFIEFSKKNSSTFSLENARILMAATQETDVLLKQICEKWCPKPNKKMYYNEEYYRLNLASVPEMHKLPSLEVKFLLGDISSHPYSSWGLSPRSTPIWWNANNSIKHERHKHYEKASLSCVLDAVAGLFIASIYFYFLPRNRGEFNPALFPTDSSYLVFPKPKMLYSKPLSTFSRPSLFSVDPLVLENCAFYEIP
jgi:hypothetical protein